MGFFQNTLTGLGACKPCRPHTGEQVNAAPRRAEREPRQLPDALCAIGHARGKFRHDLRSKLFAAAQRVQRGALGGRGRGIYHAVVDAFHRPRNGLRRYNVAHAEARHHKILAEAVDGHRALFHARQRQNRQKWLAVTKAGVNIIRHHQQVVLPGKARHRLQRRSGITHTRGIVGCIDDQRLGARRQILRSALHIRLPAVRFAAGHEHRHAAAQPYLCGIG